MCRSWYETFCYNPELLYQGNHAMFDPIHWYRRSFLLPSNHLIHPLLHWERNWRLLQHEAFLSDQQPSASEIPHNKALPLGQNWLRRLNWNHWFAASALFLQLLHYLWIQHQKYLLSHLKSKSCFLDRFSGQNDQGCILWLEKFFQEPWIPFRGQCRIPAHHRYPDLHPLFWRSPRGKGERYDH